MTKLEAALRYPSETNVPDVGLAAKVMKALDSSCVIAMSARDAKRLWAAIPEEKRAALADIKQTTISLGDVGVSE